ncbi:MAG TPA: DegT/DnrJ/EryC1/StrS family aminotransferase, partial [Thermodesulfobacteriota bacterium]|nr:DegT/DnrJ/EryC1/StrS family aminotransferase [Thermodesulfobacteriota bacterium]
RHVYHLYAVKIGKRERLQAFLKKRGIETLIHYPIPIPLQKAFRELGYRKKDFPLTNWWSRKILSLPFFPEMKESEMREVAEGIGSFLRHQ